MDWPQYKITTKDMKKLLATDNKWRTTWHVTAEDRNLETLEEKWDWAKIK
jgi:hypothetical protein